MITPKQRVEVERIFRAAGFDGELLVAPVLGADERVFVVPPGSRLAGHRDTEAALQNALGRKVWIVEQSDSWPVTEQLH